MPPIIPRAFERFPLLGGGTWVEGGGSGYQYAPNLGGQSVQQGIMNGQLPTWTTPVAIVGVMILAILTVGYVLGKD